MQINILGTVYAVNYYNYDDKPIFKERGISGYHDDTDMEIAIVRMKTHPGFETETDEYCRKNEKYTLRHEIVHAFLSQSGLNESSMQCDGGWAKNEEMVDWFAYQFPKIFKAYVEADCMPDDYLDFVSTATLTRELEKRDGVDSTVIPPYQEVHFVANGPAVVLNVKD